MGEMSRRWFMRSASPTEKLDLAIDFAEESIQAVLRGLDLPPGLSETERVRAQFRALRAVGA